MEKLKESLDIAISIRRSVQCLIIETRREETALSVEEWIHR